MAELPPINFKALNAALLPRALELCQAWLPGGDKRGAEYVVHSPWRSEKTPSLCVRLSGENAGQWGDFGGDRRGVDLVQLYAEIHGMAAGAAAVELARQYGLEDVAGIVKRGAQASAPRPPPPPPPAPPPKADTGPAESWRTALPVPDFAPVATFKHYHRQAEDITHTAEYRVDGHLMGYVVRFRTSDGGKETLPYTWCVSEQNGQARWSWRQWDEPRPLYYPGGKSPAAVQGERLEPPTVVVVEGERKAGLLQALLDAGMPGIYLVVSWPGGSKAWKKALWDWLAGCTVLLWPDCDGKREPLTKEERAQYTDDSARELAQVMKPLLPAHKQVGMVAMLGIGALLRDQHRCKVAMLQIPEPGDVEDGWDAADAIEKDGWDLARVLEFFGRAQPLPEPEGPPAEKSAAPAAAPASAGGGGQPPAGGDDGDAGVGGEDEDEFRQHLEYVCAQMACKVYQLRVNRKLVIAALRKSALLQGCVGFNELTDGPETRQAWPWRATPGPLIDSDPLRLGDFLSRHYKLPGASKASLEEAIDTVADENRFHPIRDWLKSIKHDGKPRIDRWLIHVLGLDEATLKPVKRRYLQLVGRYLLLGLVARVLSPGCKFDYTPVLEGKGGLGKSTLIKDLVGAQYFSDTHFEIGSGKDPYEQLAGIWGYELSEMTALRRADSEQAKQFLSSQVDRFRGAYGRYVVAHPRQCVIFCSTNKRQYLYDLTGNRRYWPFDVPNRPNREWLQERREQLFAEAVALFQAGERIYPTPEEEDEYFAPEQRKRLVETAVHAKLYELLTREGARLNEGRTTSDLNVNTAFVTIADMVVALGADAAKSTQQLEGQVKGWLDAMEWKYGRQGGGQRLYGYKRPKVWPPVLSPDDEDDDAGPDGPAQRTGAELGVSEAADGGTDGAPY